MTTDTKYHYYILNTQTKEILHESYIETKLADPEQFKALLANQFWTPLFIVGMYLKDPNSVTIISKDDYLISTDDSTKQVKKPRKSKTIKNKGE